MCGRLAGEGNAGLPVYNAEVRMSGQEKEGAKEDFYELTRGARDSERAVGVGVNELLHSPQFLASMARFLPPRLADR